MDLRFAGLALIASVSLVACDDGGGGGDDDGGTTGADGAVVPGADGGIDAGPTGLPIEELPGETARVICDTVFGCLGALGEAFGTLETCNAGFEGALTNAQLEQWRAAIERGTVTYDGVAAEACIEQSGMSGCDILLVPQPDVCAGMFSGTVALGGACSIGEECMGEAYCASADCPGAAGVCTARSEGGGDCEDNTQCQTGLACDGGTCVIPEPTAGLACTEQGECALDEICVGAMDGATGICEDRASLETAALGEPCELLGDDMVLCTPGGHCAITGFMFPMSVEQECLAEVASGAACNAALPDMCPDGEYCAGTDPMGLDFDGTCEALPGDGEPCADALLGEACAAGVNCVMGTCRQPQANGASCDVDAQCFSANCEGGTCAAPMLCAP